MGDGPVGSYAQLRGHEQLRLDGSLAVRGDVRRERVHVGKTDRFKTQEKGVEIQQR